MADTQKPSSTQIETENERKERLNRETTAAAVTNKVEKEQVDVVVTQTIIQEKQDQTILEEILTAKPKQKEKMQPSKDTDTFNQKLKRDLEKKKTRRGRSKKKERA